MNDPNIKCLLCCASAITGDDVNSISQFHDFLLYYKIIDMPPDTCSFQNLIKIFSEFFNEKLPNVFKDESDDDTLLKTLLLSIVVYILKSNESNKKSKLMQLCEKIPRPLHANAYAMIAPIIMRYTDDDPITEQDLEKCLKDCDKENQTMFFSPIKTNDRATFPNQHTFATHKQKIHQSLKASRNYENFTTFDDDFHQNEDEEPSSFVKLVNYVQSPDYQTSKLIKSNRDLGKSVNELEYKLYMTSNFETELDKAISRWKEKCKSLENKLKQSNSLIHSKDEEIIIKNAQIEQYSNLVNVNKRLEEKMKDYQNKVEEIQMMHLQQLEMIEENQKLKVENNNLNHYYSLAKQRRIELETITKEYDQQKQINSELEITKERLSKAESQLAELQSMHENQSHECLSDTSFNNSFYNPEPMSYVVEKERDELIGELTRLKETTLDKTFHESTVHNLNAQLSSSQEQLLSLTNQLSSMMARESEAILFCSYSKEDRELNSQSHTGNLLIEKIKQLCEKHSIEQIDMLEKLANSSIIYENLSRSHEDKETRIQKLVLEIQEVNGKLTTFEEECRSEFESFGIDADFKFNGFIECLKEKLTDQDLAIEDYERQVELHKSKVNKLNDTLYNVFDNLKCLKDQVAQLKKDDVCLFTEMSKEILKLKDSITEGTLVTPFSQPWLESLYNCCKTFMASKNTCEELKRKYEHVTEDFISLQTADEFMTLTKECLQKQFENSVSSYEQKLVNVREELSLKFEKDTEVVKMSLENDFKMIKMELIQKHETEEREMKCDLEKLIKDYQESLDQWNALGLEHELTLNSKDNVIEEEVRKVDEADKRIRALDYELLELNRVVIDYQTRLSMKEEELASQIMLLEDSCNVCKVQENNIKELTYQLDKMNETLLNEHLVESEAFNKRFMETLGLYEDSKMLTQQLQTEISVLRYTTDIELTKFNDEIQRNETELTTLRSELSKKTMAMDQLLLEHQNILDEHSKIGLENEYILSAKDNLIASGIEKFNNVNKLNLDLENVLTELNKSVDTYKTILSSKDEELISHRIQLKEYSNTCSNQECEIRDLTHQIDEMKYKEEVLNGYLTESEVLKERYEEISSLYEASKILTQQLQTEVDEIRQTTDLELLKLNEEVKNNKFNFVDLGSQLSEKNVKIEQMISANAQLNIDIEDLRNKERVYFEDRTIKEEEVTSLRKDLDNAIKTIDNLKLTLSKANTENERVVEQLTEKSIELDKMDGDNRMVLCQVSTLKEDLKNTTISLSENIDKNHTLETAIVVKDKKIDDLQSCAESYGGQISSLSSLLATLNNEIVAHQNELELKTSRISQIEKENENNGIRMKKMNELIEELEETNRLKTAKLSNSYLEISSLKQLINDHELTNERLQAQLNDTINDIQSKDVDICKAKASITDYSNKIHSLECTIEMEMQNYEKINNEYKHIEEESINYMKKYNDLTKENRESIASYQNTIDQLTERIHRFEEERDDQIHAMEKSFNSKIFDLQQIVEDNASEIQCIKEESVDCRKVHKSVRLKLESEIERLQKVLHCREIQFQEEKSSLKTVLEKEREDKLKYKEGCEREIEQLQHQMKCAEEKSSMELNEANQTVSILESKVNEHQMANYRLNEELKTKEIQYQTNVNLLENRVRELEPLSAKIKHIEQKTRNLQGQLTQLESSDNIKELQQLRQKYKSVSECVNVLEVNEKKLKMDKSKLEQQIRTLMDDCEELSSNNKTLKNEVDRVKDELKNCECRSESRQVTIENHEREIRTLSNDCEAQNKRYLALKEINERHKSEVERDHQAAVTNYIERIESLTKDVASFQEQVQLLTQEKNTLLEKTYSTKRTLEEQTAKLDSLQKVIWNHAENERRQMMTTYDENSRYNRMSHWSDKPQIMRQLPPVSSFDRQIVESMGLNASSRLRFESYISSPYTMEDESSLYIAKELPPLPPRKTNNDTHNSQSDLSIPIRKKKKDGIRLNLSNKIRKSFNMEPLTPRSKKHLNTDPIQSSSIASGSVKSEMSSSSSKPPIPKKSGFFGGFKSSRKSHLNVIDIDELQRREYVTKLEFEETQLTNVTPVASKSRNTKAAPSPSIYSLFTQNADEQNTESPGHKQPPMVGSDRDPNDNPRFTQSAKTPKANKVLKTMIRRSKHLTPKRKHSSTDSL